MVSLEDIEGAGGYQIVYADPAWAYDNGGRGAAENHYPTMSIAEIQALPVRRLAAKDSVLFLWGTWPHLPDVLLTIEKWGFEFKTNAFDWIKYHEESGKRCFGGGFWTRANTEFCLIGVRGDAPRRQNAAIRQLIETGPEDVLLAPRQEHSAKPKEARDRIVALMGDLPRIELFARERAEGWDAWGNDPALGEPDVALVCPACKGRKYVKNELPDATPGSALMCLKCR